MCVACDQAPAPQSLQARMLHDTLHQPFSQAAAAERFEHEHVSDVSVGRVVGDYSRESDLLALGIQSEAQRVLDGTSDHVTRDSLGPITLNQEFMDYGHVNQSTIGANGELAFAVFTGLLGLRGFGGSHTSTR